MKPVICLSILLAAGFDVAAARPANLHIRRNHNSGIEKRSAVWNAKLGRREVPQEHSHEKFLTTVDQFLNMDNPDGIVDAVFGLLGNAAAAGGQGDISNTDCLQQATADRAFTNAKAAGDVDGMTAALIYRALERNTGAVGQASVPCTAIQAVNPEIAAISQHQDPASANAATVNKDIILALAVQIANIGGNPLDALQSGTFAPGTIGDPTAKGNSCDDQNDPVGCIFTQNLLVEDATEDEVNAAVAASATTSGGAAAATDTSSVTATTTESAVATECTVPPAAAETTVSASTTVAAVAATTTSSAAAATSTITTGSSDLDFGSCPDPTIIFANGLDGRTEPAFEPHDETNLPHGSAQNIQVITDFICQQLGPRCHASQAATDACNQAAAAAQAQTGQAAADAFNQALGF
ncbi:uncharacterized protein Z520_08668 [Fonsecaea multimorphosa CBS 102226]|uniref:Uncharacterized protein n=1 Tax=Fonsecaea multimorphosa CBS 102226 TaxID=1442371 RepID=A0A0D2KFU2_9EURO|nr:uncharacterized protein Z520_08668 [Fonsecaea multimorphosa CBS 102226]KIX95548.1 hypothetical protein Z520_08668 [Fonsecaea multimorphosa CBS 102226]OAL21394.1 hypothetical protein AYO22_08117 [Fonsecaea multimorphosa]